MTPNVIPVLIMRARRRVVEHLVGVGATSAGAAVVYIPRRKLERNALAHLQRHGAVKLEEGGRYWINEVKAAELRRSTRTRAAVLIGGALAATAAAFAMTR